MGRAVFFGYRLYLFLAVRNACANAGQVFLNVLLGQHLALFVRVEVGQPVIHHQQR